MSKSALLVMEDGTRFHGQAIGVTGFTVGEVVFNTSMTGYQEIVTDPSYSHQIVTLTYPHIGNVGINATDAESSQIHVRGLIVRDLSLATSNFRSEESFSSYLQRNNIIGISNVDTRKLTRLLRTKGTQNGCIISGNDSNISLALKNLQEFSGLQGVDLVKEVTTTKYYIWQTGSSAFKGEEKQIIKLLFNVVVYDYGIKRNILRMLVDRGCRLIVVPAQTTAEDVLKLNPDGIFLSNGPGDPKSCDYAIKAIKILLNTNIPIFGICLGHQLLALANGAKIIKMKHGHHGANHPVKDLDNNIVIITAQNHNFTVDKSNLTTNHLRITHISLFDQTIQGIHCINKPAFSFQGHPESSPGPHDASMLFDHFIALINIYRSRVK
ncbi:glutamine-hydrolyzing carbamoyl-phosphate synthase small subunit [Pantoea sp. Mhis]|uniref:glutamine-hydrolyzing carbamoyl-phosphate synthase small subunit n=1 Tax=Pantoea sp. Mhis TaxID=2576759 RepID=UPI001358860D|nr:glutamine-hydrolyzing carbamoyl-phosphate synthase small subunit [Pantoea sp. Mhis]MXP56474.1 glutamine-hydrolyzing carbamoyl-phosphate synthase small subunit [Pantoea sp. Mhis]